MGQKIIYFSYLPGGLFYLLPNYLKRNINSFIKYAPYIALWK